VDEVNSPDGEQNSLGRREVPFGARGHPNPEHEEPITRWVAWTTKDAEHRDERDNPD
jgi:hypothetical protein